MAPDKGLKPLTYCLEGSCYYSTELIRQRKEAEASYYQVYQPSMATNSAVNILVVALIFFKVISHFTLMGFLFGLIIITFTLTLIIKPLFAFVLFPILVHLLFSFFLAF